MHDETNAICSTAIPESCLIVLTDFCDKPANDPPRNLPRSTIEAPHQKVSVVASHPMVTAATEQGSGSFSVGRDDDICRTEPTECTLLFREIEIRRGVGCALSAIRA